MIFRCDHCDETAQIEASPKWLESFRLWWERHHLHGCTGIAAWCPNCGDCTCPRRKVQAHA